MVTGCQTHAEHTASVKIVGNKSDAMDKDRVVSFHEGQAFAADYKCSFQETSAGTGDSVSYLFEELVKKICDKIEDGDLPDESHGVS